MTFTAISGAAGLLGLSGEPRKRTKAALAEAAREGGVGGAAEGGVRKAVGRLGG